MFRLKSKKQRKNSLIVLRAINRINRYETSENHLYRANDSLGRQQGSHSLTS
jgi:hypothetical protein